MNRTLTLTAALSGALLALSATSVMAQGNKLTTQDKMFMMKSSEGNIAEIKVARLALKKARHEDVKMVANMIIKGHTVAQNDLMGVARRKDVKLPMVTNAKHRRDYAMLSKLSGEAFDKAYLKGQVRDHYATVNLFNRELTVGQDSDARGFASKYLPDIQNHTAMIDKAAMSHSVPTPAKFGDKMPAMNGMSKMDGAASAAAPQR